MSGRLRSASYVLFASLGLSLVACGDDTGGAGTGGGTGEGGAGATTGATTGGTGGGSATGTGTTTGSGGGGAECELPEPNPSPAEPRSLTEVQGNVVDEGGAPVAGVEVQICGKDICLYGETDAAGDVVVTHDGSDIDTPIFKVGDGLELAKVGLPIPAGDPPTVDAVLPSMADSGTALAAGATAEADGVVLSVAADGVVKLNLLDFSGPGEDTFRAGVLPAEHLETVAPGEGLDMIVGLGPYDTHFCPAAALTLPNEADLPAGAAVELLLYGLDVGEHFVPYGKWTAIADGQVSEDGTSIAFDGEVLPVLFPVAVRLAD